MSAVNPSLPQNFVLPEKVKSGGTPLALKGLTLLALGGFFVGLYLSLFYAGTDQTQGAVQRIFYQHVAAFSGAFVGFVTASVAGGLYLRTKNPKWDTLAVAGIEVGLALSMITLITGSVWARPIWNTWWTWDPRLTSMAIMVLTYVAYLMLRNGIENVDRRRTFSAVYGMLAISTVIFTFIITRIRPDTIHPTVIGPSVTNQSEGGFAMAANMSSTMGMNSVIWCFFIAPALIWWRVRLQNAVELVQQKKSIYLGQ
jgi:heme exporter protein C